MTEIKTVGEILEEANRLHLKQAVRDELVEFLTQFIPTDAHEPTKGLSSSVSADVVPSEIVEEVRDELLSQKAEVEKQIKGLMGHSVSSAKAKSKRKAPIKKVPTKKVPTKKAPRKAPIKRRKTNAKEKQPDQNQ